MSAEAAAGPAPDCLHVGQYQVLEASGAARTAGLIIILERLEKVGVCLLELSLAEVHLPATLCKRVTGCVRGSGGQGHERGSGQEVIYKIT